METSSGYGEVVGGNTLFVCGASSFFINHHLSWALAVAPAGRHVALTPDRPGDADLLRGRGFTVHELRERRGSANPMRVAREIMDLRRVARRVRPGRMVAITLKSFFTAAMANHGRDPVPLAGFVTGLGYLFTGNGAKRRLLRGLSMPALRLALRRMPHAAVFSNEDDRDEFLGRRIVEPGRAMLVPVPGIDPEVFTPAPEPAEGFRVVLPARMLFEKGVEEFVRAAEMLRRRIPRGEFVLAGAVDPGNPAAIPEERLRHWHEEGNVRWLGRVTRMPALYASSHGVCLPSYREGFPRSLVEAMACGRAVVTTDTPGCRDVAGRQGERGLLVPVRDCEALAEAIHFLYRHPRERRAMAARSRLWVEESMTEAMIAARVAAVLETIS